VKPVAGSLAGDILALLRERLPGTVAFHELVTATRQRPGLVADALKGLRRRDLIERAGAGTYRARQEGVSPLHCQHHGCGQLVPANRFRFCSDACMALAAEARKPMSRERSCDTCGELVKRATPRGPIPRQCPTCHRRWRRLATGQRPPLPERLGGPPPAAAPPAPAPAPRELPPCSACGGPLGVLEETVFCVVNRCPEVLGALRKGAA
jgi:hypothetical protein